MTDRYQSAPGLPGTFPTEEWFAALMRGIDGPLGHVLDIGCAEGVMSVLALKAGAEHVLGLDTNPERVAAAKALTVGYNLYQAQFYVQRSDALVDAEYRTVILSMVAHWLGQEETARLARFAERNLAIVFREANDHYQIPENGTWFPTFEELDATVGGVRTHEELLLTQDHDKRVWAATYRRDVEVRDGMVHREGREPMPLRKGFDLHGDAPFRPTHGRPVLRLSGPNADAVRELVRRLAREVIDTGEYPSDLSPRNIIVGPDGAFLVDRDPSEEMPYRGRIDPEFLPIWRSTLSSIGVDFDGDVRGLL